MRELRCSVVGVVAAMLLCASAVHAEEPQDEVVLASGNRISGQVRGLSRGELAFRIAGVGTVDINWSAVESLTTVQRLDIDLASGQRLSGTITTTADGKLTVMSESGPNTIEKAEAIRFTRIGATVRERTSGDFDLGINFYTAGGHELDWVFNGEIQNRTQNSLTEASLTSNIRQTGGDTSRDRTRLTFDSRRFLADRWFVVGLFEAENDQGLDLDSRFLIGAAGGRTLFQSNRNLLSVYGGFDYTRENYRAIENTFSNPEALGSLEWDVFEINGVTDLLVKATGYAALNQARGRAQLKATLRRELTGNFYWSLNVFEEYDSAPPNGYPRSDFGGSITIGYALPRL